MLDKKRGTTRAGGDQIYGRFGNINPFKFLEKEKQTLKLMYIHVTHYVFYLNSILNHINYLQQTTIALASIDPVQLIKFLALHYRSNKGGFICTVRYWR